MCALASIESGPRGRTRRAILDAAMAVLSDHPTAPLSDIAAAAQVGRSTVHRYFPERSDLIRALAVHVHAISSAAIAAADPACGPPIAALRRVVESQLDLGPMLLYIYNEPTVMADPDLVAHLDTGDEAIIEVLNRVSADRPDLPRKACHGRPRHLRRLGRRLRARHPPPTGASPHRRNVRLTRQSAVWDITVSF